MLMRATLQFVVAGSSQAVAGAGCTLCGRRPQGLPVASTGAPQVSMENAGVK